MQIRSLLAPPALENTRAQEPTRLQWEDRPRERTTQWLACLCLSWYITVRSVWVRMPDNSIIWTPAIKPMLLDVHTLPSILLYQTTSVVPAIKYLGRLVLLFLCRVFQKSRPLVHSQQQAESTIKLSGHLDNYHPWRQRLVEHRQEGVLSDTTRQPERKRASIRGQHQIGVERVRMYDRQVPRLVIRRWRCLGPFRHRDSRLEKYRLKGGIQVCCTVS